MAKIFIDGSAGTTGLRIGERLSQRKNLEIITIPDEYRKDTEKRKEAINSSDITFLCLPDDASREAVALVENPNTVIIDTSTAHRTDNDWAYGFAELNGLREKILASKKIANPGCHASGFISLIRPLTDEGLLKTDVQLSCFSLTGYSGGGKKMIAEYEGGGKSSLLEAPRMYGITQQHKHLKEMVKIAGIEKAPAFCPIVSDFYSGMEVVVTIFKGDLNSGADPVKEIKEIYRNYYTGGIVKYKDDADESGFMSAAGLSGKDSMEISVAGNEDRILLVSRFDNLGKGASGAAIQNMNIILGLDETEGLEL